MFDLLAPKFGVLELSCSGKLLLLEKKQEQTPMALGCAAKVVDSFGKGDRACAHRGGQGWEFSC